MPVTDSGEVLGKTKTGLLRIFSKLMERSQFKGRYKETEMISFMTESQKQIGKKLSDSRKDQLEDIYGLTASFLELYQRLDDFNQIEHGKEVKKILQKETDELLQQFFKGQSFGNRSRREIQGIYEYPYLAGSAFWRSGLLHP